MSESQLATRYAQAIFEIGEESGQLQQLSSELAKVAEHLNGSKALLAALTDPAVSEERRFSILQGLSGPLGLGPVTLNTLKLLVRRRRIGALPDIASALVSRADARRGVIRVKVTSAKPLSDAYYERLTANLETSLKRKVQLEKVLDSNLIAGLTLQIGNNSIDGTVRGRLEKYEHQLLSQH
jgi:F-type H+-transporting ATPase subunit delta